MCDEKSRGFCRGRRETEEARRGKERRTREQLREDEHEYAGLVRSVRARTKDERGDDRASGRRSDEGRERDGRKKEGERDAAAVGPFALF